MQNPFCHIARRCYRRTACVFDLASILVASGCNGNGNGTADTDAIVADASDDTVDLTDADTVLSTDSAAASDSAVETAAGDVDVGGSNGSDTNATDADTSCPLSASPCPVAVLEVVPADPQVPGSTDKWLATASKPGCGQIVQYLWTVTWQGEGVASVNGSTFVAPPETFNKIGEYSICLDVWDSSGTKSCVAVCQKFLLVAASELSIELVWTTPGKPLMSTQTADLDLHFSHPSAGGADLDCDGQGDPWFDPALDCWSWNNTPDWGLPVPEVADDPSHSGDNLYELEQINIAAMEGDAVLTTPYHIGVHYWDDHGWGPSVAMVRGFANGALMFETKQTTLQPGDMWNIGRIWSPNVPGAKSMEFCGQTGKSCEAGQNLMWSPGGKECITPCYSPVGLPVGMTPYLCP